MQNLTRAVLFPFMLLAALGFVLSVIAHLLGILGWAIPGGKAVWSLHVGIFVVWLPAVLVTMAATRQSARRDMWTVVLAGCPDWMRYGLYAVGAYAAANFVLFILTAGGHPPPKGDAPPSVVRGFSGHWMIFYYAAAAILYSVIHSPRMLQRRTCKNGHLVSHQDSFCPICGTPIQSRDVSIAG